jgi:hypothetical protein
VSLEFANEPKSRQGNLAVRPQRGTPQVQSQEEQFQRDAASGPIGFAMADETRNQTTLAARIA